MSWHKCCFLVNALFLITHSRLQTVRLILSRVGTLLQIKFVMFVNRRLNRLKKGDKKPRLRLKFALVGRREIRKNVFAVHVISRGKLHLILWSVRLLNSVFVKIVVFLLPMQMFKNRGWRMTTGISFVRANC